MPFYSILATAKMDEIVSISQVENGNYKILQYFNFSTSRNDWTINELNFKS